MSISDLATNAQRALERGDPAALAMFDRAIKGDPGNARLWLGKARALELVDDRKGARIVAQQIADQAPGFIDAQDKLAEMRLAAGEPDFASHYAKAASRQPRDPNILAAWCNALGAVDRSGEAADIAAQARSRFPDEPHFTLLEAMHAGAGGEWDRAEAIFASLASSTPQRLIQEARHRLRAEDSGKAQTLLDQALAKDPWNIAAWALLDIVWRISGDARADWLHGQEGLVQIRPLAGREGLVSDAASELRKLHDNSAMPIGQSLRGGSQTRGILFDRAEPIFAELRDAILATLKEYRADLPPLDETHPLLRHRETPWSLAGSWSVRLAGGDDHHASHIHPAGIVSSALYLVVPEAAADETARQGWLELGRPPRDLGLELPALATIKPKPGHLALFPSTMYHGTTPFGAVGQSERMTVAFDVKVS
ncbi:2OG-Fe(II) oxygenase family protein [Erythrobacter rubeus]|nr:putative 2OG-Fe(II) oxygenase [Erythrobacter rubeus]